MINFAQVGNDLYTGKRSIEFIKRQKTWYAVSAVLIALALVGIFVKHLNFGIEFSGGSEFRVQGVTNSQDYEQKAQDAIGTAGIEGNVVSTIVGQNTVRVQSEAASERTDEASAALAKEFGVPTSSVSASLIGPSWGQSVSQQAIQGLIVFLILVTIVMALYFRTWKMAVAGLVALLHDLVITVGIYALFGFEITPSSMIGFLTILGYSLYDTVVVFDKVRENTRGITTSVRRTYAEGANLAVNQTLVRSINTSIAALLPVGAILYVGWFQLGTGPLKDLALALFVGMAAGTYSSICIATPLLAQLKMREPVMVAQAKRVMAHRATQAREAARAGAPVAAAAAAGGRADSVGAADGGFDGDRAEPDAAPAPRSERPAAPVSNRPTSSAASKRAQPQRQTRSKRGKR
jgi:preprotein translocase subunit SecF